MTEHRDQSNVDTTAGWSNLGGQARKFHYFDTATAGTMALCGKWAIGREHPLEPDLGAESPDDCAGCRRRLNARRPTDD